MSTTTKQRTERRRATRVSADLPLTVTAKDAGAAATLKDLSTHGLCCVFSEPIPEMTLVRLVLELAGEKLAIEGAVVRSERLETNVPSWEIAVFYTTISDKDREKLHAFVNEGGQTRSVNETRRRE